MTGRTFAGIVLVAACGMLLAWLFRHENTPTEQPARLQANSSLNTTRDDRSKGRIVPLVVDEGFSGTAFIGAAPADESNQTTQPRQPHTLRLPTIRRGDGQADPSSPPRLGTSFPRPLLLLGIEESAAGSTAIEEKSTVDGIDEISESAQRKGEPSIVHIVADGDTLPKIAEQYLGDPSRADELFRLNQQKLPSFELLPIGVELEIPSDSHL